MDCQSEIVDTPPPTQPTGVVFSNNRSIPLNFKEYTGAFDYHEEMNMYVFGTVGGSIAYRSPRYQFDLDNPLEDQVVLGVYFADYKGLVVSLSGQHVQVWDVFYDPGLNQFVHRVVHAGKPSALCSWRAEKSMLIGTTCGKVHVMDIVRCSMENKYAAASYLPAISGIGITFLSVYESDYCTVGSADGLVRLFKLGSKKCIGQLKSPAGIRTAVNSVSVLPSRDFPPTRSFAVCYLGEEFVAIFSHTYNLLLTVRTELPALRAFGISVDWEKDGLLVHLASKRLVLLEGTKWAANSQELLSDKNACLGINPGGQTLFSLESFSLEERTLLGKRIRTKWGLPRPTRNPLIAFLDHKEYRTENNLVRLSNLLQDRPLAENFIREWNDRQIEGVYVVVSEKNRLQWTIFSNSSSYCMGETLLPCEKSDLEIVTAIDICSLEGTDKWSLLLGYSSGRVALFESTTVLNSAACGDAVESMWKKPVWLEGPSGIHIGARIKKIERMDDLCVSVDMNGMCCFFKTDDSEEPSHVAICGENGTCFLDTNCAYLCMTDGTIERVRVPRKSVEESLDVDAWDTVALLEESVGLSGEFIALLPKHRVVVRQTGFARVNFPARHGSLGQVTKVVVTVGGAADSKILAARMYWDFLVLASNGSVWVYDLQHRDICVFNRDFDIPLSGSLPVLSPSMHVIVPGESITSLLFANRSKEMHTTGPIVEAARSFYRMAKNQAIEATDPVSPTPEKSKSGSPSKSTKPGKYAPTMDQLEYAREVLRMNLESASKLEDDAYALQEESANFLRVATRLNEGPPNPKKKSFWKRMFS